MIRRIVVATSAALLAAALPAAARAQAHFGISAGASIPESRFGESVNTGFNVNGMVNVAVPLSPLGFRGEVGFNRFDFGSNVNGNVRMLNGTANVVLMPSYVMTAKPYLIAGVGVYNVKSSFDNADAPLGSLFRASASESSDTRLGFNGGVGLSFGLGPIGTLLEARYVTVNGKNGGGSLAFIPVSFGITF
jgi:opacity protein-like surface antigen